MMFNAIDYFKRIAADNRLVDSNKFTIGTCSGIEGLEPLMQNFRKAANYFMVDDTVDASLVGNGIGWFNRRVYTVFIFAQYRIDDMEARQVKLELCRKIFLQIVSRLIRDREEHEYNLVYMRTSNIQYREIASYNLSGCTGVYFMISVDEPTDLSYNEQDWSNND